VNIHLPPPPAAGKLRAFRRNRLGSYGQ